MNRKEDSGGGDILLVSTDRLGDLVWTLPALEHVRRTFPRARLSFLASEYAGGLLEGHPAVDRLFRIQRNTHSLGKLFHYLVFLARWGRKSPDLLVVFKGGHLGRSIGKRLGANQVYSILDYPEEKRRAVHPARLRLELVERFCGPLEGPPWPALRVPAPFREKARKMLEELGWEPRSYVVLHPGANKLVRYRSIVAPPDARSTLRLWPMDRWKELARELSLRGIGALLTGSPPEGEACREIASAGGEGVRSLAGNLHVLELAALLESARAVVVCDTGPAHLGAAVGTPVVSLFGPTDPALTAPVAPPERLRVVKADLPCSPCKHKPGVRCRDNRCMQEIQAARVLRALEDLGAL